MAASAELKDLITKILTINYDDRPSLNEILSHPFIANHLKA